MELNTVSCKKSYEAITRVRISLHGLAVILARSGLSVE